MENTHTLIFSLRDWKQGCELLTRIGLNDNELISNTFDLRLNENWVLENLQDELNSLGIEFDLEQLNN